MHQTLIQRSKRREHGCIDVDFPNSPETRLASKRAAFDVTQFALTTDGEVTVSLKKGPENEFAHSSGIFPVMLGPNISGELQLERPLLPTGGIHTGPFSTRWSGGYRYSFEGSYGTSNNNVVVFEASSTSSVFGERTTVQPDSLRLLPCVKS